MLDWTERGLARFMPGFGTLAKARCARPANVVIIADIGSAPEWAAETVARLDEYFSGAAAGGFDAPLDWTEATPFQKKIWNATKRIPYGGTRTYSQVARSAGAPRASRAAGKALGANPLPVVVPCHRVLRADGSPGGFSCGGPEVKKALLFLEQGSPVDFGVVFRGRH